VRFGPLCLLCLFGRGLVLVLGSCLGVAYLQLPLVVLV
jgi:hypothetical protein